ncbi:hypothetical protein [Vibrio salinus]|uniref:hypothetical protein n=1 Tax=Vibrio salinus TaxID=2899784 RepID=UPI001E5313E4|nr:hypothetical protein [Vibrio salinus]MCE0496129.1 hypothetical protein [Vibrio salinus]
MHWDECGWLCDANVPQSTAIAYNSDMIAHPPSSYDELVKWTKKHPKAFGYNGNQERYVWC